MHARLRGRRRAARCGCSPPREAKCAGWEFVTADCGMGQSDSIYSFLFDLDYLGRMVRSWAFWASLSVGNLMLIVRARLPRPPEERASVSAGNSALGSVLTDLL